MDERIEELIVNYKELHQHLLNQGQVSFASTVSSYYQKVLVFSCASLFENKICNTIYNVAKRTCPAAFADFVRNKAVERQYHTYFNWKNSSTTSINSFLGLWGEDFKTNFLSLVKSNERLAVGVKAFLQIGQERNLMAHENFIEYYSANSFEEIALLYEQADYFVLELIKYIESMTTNINV